MRLLLVGLVACCVACGVETGSSTSTTSAASTTCVSDPIVAGDDDGGRDEDIVPHCPNPVVAQQAASAYADQNYPATPRAEGGCDCNANNCVCLLVLYFGGGQNIVIECSVDAQGHTECASTHSDG